LKFSKFIQIKKALRDLFTNKSRKAFLREMPMSIVAQTILVAAQSNMHGVLNNQRSKTSNLNNVLSNPH